MFAVKQDLFPEIGILPGEPVNGADVEVDVGLVGGLVVAIGAVGSEDGARAIGDCGGRSCGHCRRIHERSAEGTLDKRGVVGPYH